jgi:excinuclease ABC subunit A
LERLLGLLEKIAPEGEYVWGHKQVIPRYVEGQKEPWAAVQTKKADAVYLTLAGPKGRFALGRLTGLGHSPALDAERPEVDLVRLRFRSLEDLQRGDLAEFLKEHLATVKVES